MYREEPRMHTRTPTETKTNTHTCFMDLTWCGCRPHWLRRRTDAESPPPPPLHLSPSPALSSVGSVCLSRGPSSSQGTRDVSPQSSWPDRQTGREISRPRWHQVVLSWNVSRCVVSIPLSAAQRLHVEVREQAGEVTGALILYRRKQMACEIYRTTI